MTAATVAWKGDTLAIAGELDFASVADSVGIRPNRCFRLNRSAGLI
jgi:hypothetical protein